MLNVVVDSSVAIKWVLPEVLQAEANALRELWDEGQIHCWAPSLLFAEIASVFWKRARKNELSSDVCLEAVGLLQSLPWNVTPSRPCPKNLCDWRLFTIARSMTRFIWHLPQGSIATS